MVSTGISTPFATGPISRGMIDELRRYVVMDPKPFAVDLEASRGMELATVDGQRLFDWSGYYGSKLLGHNHPALDEPAYVRRLVRAANNKVANPDFLTAECLAYYRLLHELRPTCMAGPGVEVYAVNSGAEAVENMMKYLINLHDEKPGTPRRGEGVRRFIYFDNAFHGRTVFALNITSLDHDPIVTEDFHGLTPGHLRAPFPVAVTGDDDANQAKARHSLSVIEGYLRQYAGEVVGIIVEPIQGAGGHRVAPPGFFRRLSQLAHEHDVYLGFDEVQTAGGQVGGVFAVDRLDLPHPPQAVATGKKLGNGVVYMLATMADKGVLDSTWGGNLADMVRVVREFEVVRAERLIEAVADKAARLVDGLRALAERFAPLIGNVRGMGLYQGFSCRDAATAAELRRGALHDESVLLLGAGPGEVRLRPVLDVTAGDIDRLIDLLGRCLERMKH